MQSASQHVLVSFTNFTPLFGPDGRFAFIVAALCRAVAAALGRGLLDGTVILLVWRRVKRAEQLLLALAERVRLGRYRGGIVRRSGGFEAFGADLVEAIVAPLGATAGSAGAPTGSQAWRRLPRRFGWLMGLMPYEAAGYSSQLAHLLAEPEMVSLLCDVPQAGRILGPLCWMLGIEARLVRPGVLTVERVPRAAAGPRVRAIRQKVDWGRIPLPRGILARALRDRRLEAARARVVELRKGDSG